eukprot:2883855-Rhodomonas_salina.1
MLQKSCIQLFCPCLADELGGGTATSEGSSTIALSSGSRGPAGDRAKIVAPKLPCQRQSSGGLTTMGSPALIGLVLTSRRTG